MNNIGLHNLLDNLKEYNLNEIEAVKSAYEYAVNLHSVQTRLSGENYISHALNVAYILSKMHADRDTVCAGLLHDTLEDTNLIKEDIFHDFNQTIANLIDGVTKLSKMNFLSQQIQSYVNTRKIITGITEDVRIKTIKLADRLYNMKTLQFESELENLSLKYSKLDMYKKIEERKTRLGQTSSYCFIKMLSKIKYLLKDNNISNEIKVRTKNIYGVYKSLGEGHKLFDIHDLLAIKIMVNIVENCYRILGMIHSEYYPINNKFKDYICNPKINMYRSLHTTVFGSEDKLVQIQVRTFDMDRIVSFELTAYWDEQKGKARDVMQEYLRQKFQFFKFLTEINSMFGDNQQFVK